MRGTFKAFLNRLVAYITCVRLPWVPKHPLSPPEGPAPDSKGSSEIPTEDLRF